VKKKLPTVFVCPRCGEEAVRVTIAKDTGHATVLCALCNLKDEFPAHPAAQAIDVYSYFTDRFYGVKEPRAIIPREREFQHVPGEEGTAEEEAEAQPPEAAAAPEQSLRDIPEKSELEAHQPLSEEVSHPETSEQPAHEQGPAEPSQQTMTQEAPSETLAETTTESEKESAEENEPFADILVENKDKKRYSSTPLPQQTSEQTS
jgi:transcription elongation factor Elf1